MSAYAKIGHVQKAEALLEEMYLAYTANENEAAKPDIISFNTVLNAWSKSRVKEAPERAEQIITHLEELYSSGKLDVKPDTVSYNCVINCWSKSGLVQAPAQADAILRKMWTMYENGQLVGGPPDTFSYDGVIRSWSNSKDATRNSEVVRSMMALFDEMLSLVAKGYKTVTPSLTTFNLLFRKIHFDSELSKTEKTQLMDKVLHVMKENHVTPDHRTRDILGKFYSK